MFYLGPVFRIAGGIGTLAFIPVIYGSETFSNFSCAGDLFLVIYFMFFGQLGMALGAGESGHPYSAIGIARGLSQMTAYEVPFALAVISIVIQYDTLSITEIVAAQQGGWQNWTVFTNWVATLAAMLAFLGMTGYSPFDIFLAPQEIPIGPPTEFHSAFLSMLQTNRAVFGATKLILFMNLFFGGATGWIELMIKTLADLHGRGGRRCGVSALPCRPVDPLLLQVPDTHRHRVYSVCTDGNRSLKARDIPSVRT